MSLNPFAARVFVVKEVWFAMFTWFDFVIDCDVNQHWVLCFSFSGHGEHGWWFTNSHFLKKISFGRKVHFPQDDLFIWVVAYGSRWCNVGCDYCKDCLGLDVVYLPAVASKAPDPLSNNENSLENWTDETKLAKGCQKIMFSDSQCDMGLGSTLGCTLSRFAPKTFAQERSKTVQNGF